MNQYLGCPNPEQTAIPNSNPYPTFRMKQIQFDGNACAPISRTICRAVSADAAIRSSKLSSAALPPRLNAARLCRAGGTEGCHSRREAPGSADEQYTMDDMT